MFGKYARIITIMRMMEVVVLLISDVVSSILNFNILYGNIKMTKMIKLEDYILHMMKKGLSLFPKILVTNHL